MRAHSLLSTPRLAAAGAVAALTLMVGAPAFAHDHKGDDGDKTEMTKGEKELAELLEGRVAGEPQRCIRSRPNDRLRVIDDTAYVYGSGRTIYVQRTKSPEDIDSDDILISRRFNASQVCRLDMVTTADRSFGMFTGVVFFDDFIPYTRVEKEKDEG